MIELLLWVGLIAAQAPVNPSLPIPHLAQPRVQRCGRLNPAEFVRQVNVYRRMLDADEDFRIAGVAAADMFFYWRSRCQRERFNAPRSVVQSMARLLRHRGQRHNTPLMLIDVGPNLRVAVPEVQDALRDEYDRVARDRALPGVISSLIWSRFADDLRCVLKKVETGRINKTVCTLLIMADRQYAKEGFRPQPLRGPRARPRPSSARLRAMANIPLKRISEHRQSRKQAKDNRQ